MAERCLGDSKATSYLHTLAHTLTHTHTHALTQSKTAFCKCYVRCGSSLHPAHVEEDVKLQRASCVNEKKLFLG